MNSLQQIVLNGAQPLSDFTIFVRGQPTHSMNPAHQLATTTTTDTDNTGATLGFIDRGFSFSIFRMHKIVPIHERVGHCQPISLHPSEVHSPAVLYGVMSSGSSASPPRLGRSSLAINRLRLQLCIGSLSPAIAAHEIYICSQVTCAEPCPRTQSSTRKP